MSKPKKVKFPVDDVQPESEVIENEVVDVLEGAAADLPLTPTVEKTESLIGQRTEVLKTGYVFAKLKGSDSIVQLPAKAIGKAYSTDKWEVLEGKKK